MSEKELCFAINEYLALYSNQYQYMYWHVPNENVSRNVGWVMMQKKMGMRSGVPDYVLWHEKLTLLIEVKVAKGKLSKNQKSFIKEAEDKKLGGNVIVVYGWEEFEYNIKKEFFDRIKN